MRNRAARRRHDASGHSSRHDARSELSSRGRGRSPTSAARRYRCAFRASSSARSRSSGTAASCWGAIRSSRRIASAPAISRPISPASWPGATGAFRTARCSTASAWARCAAPTARSCWAKWASIPPMPGASIFRRERPISTTSAAARSICAGSVAREVEEETGLTPADYRADAHWDCVVSGAAIAMIRILNVDVAGEALRARIEANLARQHQPELAAIHLVRGTSDLTAAMPRFVTAFIEKQFATSPEFGSPSLRGAYSDEAIHASCVTCWIASLALAMTASGATSLRRIPHSTRATGVPTVMSKKPSQSLGDQLKPFVAPFRFDGSGKFHLKSHKTNEKGGLDKDKAEKILEANRKRLNDFQEKLYAQDRWSLLLILQGMDAAGKDSAIKSIFDGVNPQGCEVHSFKQPSSLELNHDFMWRSMVALPRARPHRHLQSLLLRGMPGDAGASGNPRQGEDPAQAGDQKHLARAVRGHFRVRALSRAQRHGDPEILPQRLEAGAARAISRPARRALEELEVLDGTTSPSARCGRDTRRCIRTSSGTPRPRWRRGTWCRPITNGSRGW